LVKQFGEDVKGFQFHWQCIYCHHTCHWRKIVSSTDQPKGALPTRIFKSGNSLSVRIPSSMVPADVPRDAEIEYKGGVWTIRPIHRRKLTNLAAKFGAFSSSFMSEGRQPQAQTERGWSTKGKPVVKAPSKPRKG
jgi:antitoxin VapB